MISKSICGLRSPPWRLRSPRDVPVLAIRARLFPALLQTPCFDPFSRGIGTQQGNSPATPGEASQSLLER